MSSLRQGFSRVTTWPRQSPKPGELNNTSSSPPPGPIACLRKKRRGTTPLPRKNVGADDSRGRSRGVLRQEDPHTQSLQAFAPTDPAFSGWWTTAEHQWNRSGAGRVYAPTKGTGCVPLSESHARQGPDKSPKLQMAMSLRTFTSRALVPNLNNQRSLVWVFGGISTYLTCRSNTVVSHIC